MRFQAPVEVEGESAFSGEHGFSFSAERSSETGKASGMNRRRPDRLHTEEHLLSAGAEPVPATGFGVVVKEFGFGLVTKVLEFKDPLGGASVCNGIHHGC